MVSLDPEELTSIRSQSLANAISGQIEKMILSGELGPGERINESLLATHLGVSRSPIREACRQLEKYGMVEVKPGRGTFVRDIALEEVLELYDIRASLEVLACEQAATKFTDRDIVKLEKYIQEMKEFAESNDVQSYLRTNINFHHKIFKISENKSLFSILETITKKLTLYRASVLSRPGELFVSLDEHIKLVEALKLKNIQVLSEIIKKHVTKGKKALIEQAKVQGESK